MGIPFVSLATPRGERFLTDAVGKHMVKEIIESVVTGILRGFPRMESPVDVVYQEICRYRLQVFHFPNTRDSQLCHRIQQVPHMATVQLPVDGILGRNVAEKVPVRVVHTLRLQAILTGHVLDEEASGTIFHRIVLIMRKYLLQFRTIDT